MEEFNIHATPIEKGIFRIQANAGTGKTYTLENLCVRLIKEKSLLPENILILTFSNQAVAELKNRITQKFIDEWLTNAQGKSDVSDNLQLQHFEIYTFHAFFYKTINELGFLSKIPSYDTIDTDNFQVFRRLAGKFFRDLVYDSPEMTAFLLEIPKKHFRTEMNIIKLMSKLYSLTISPSESFSDCREFSKAVRYWFNQVIELQVLFEEEKNAFIEFISHPENINRAALNKNKLPQLIRALDELKNDGNSLKIFNRFCDLFNDNWQEKKIKNHRDFQFKFFERLEILKKGHQKLNSDMYRTLAAYINQNMISSTGSGIIFDLIQKNALELSKTDAIRTVLRDRYKAVLVDEYQDTDIIQQDFLRNLFYDNERYTFLVGDAKQSIYQFRGANMYTPSQSKPEEQIKAYSLSVNYRSQKNIIRAVNTLFDRRLNPFHYESFIANPPSLFPEKRLTKNECAGKFVLNVIQGENEKMSAAEKSHLICRTLAQRIRHLLASDEPDTPQKLSDIAILTRKNGKAWEINRYLTQNRIPSYLPASENLFETAQAKDIYAFIRLILEPDSLDFYSFLINNELLGYHLLNFLELRDENTVEKIRTRFFEARIHWQNAGIVSAFQFLDGQFQIETRLAQSENGVNKLRNYTDILQYLRTIESEQQKTPSQLSAVFEKCLSLPEAQKTKQDDIRDAVKIYTIHASKGLEFPCVFVPLENYAITDKGFNMFYDPNNKYSPSPVLDEEDKRHFQEETHAEEIRILYVALTRGVSYCEVIFNESLDRYRSILDPALSQTPESIQIVNTTLQDLDKKYPQDIRQQLPQLSEPRFYEPVKFDHTVKKSFSSLISKDYRSIPDKPVTEKAERTTPGNPELYGLNFGLLVHEVIENLDWQTYRSEQNISKLQNILRGYHIDEQETSYVLDILDKLTQKKLTDPLHRHFFSLSQISQTCLIKELMFSVRLNRCNFKDVMTPENPDEAYDKAVQEAFRQLPENSPVDFLDGFIDAVVEHESKLYVFDWKTNYLGEAPGDYHQNAMEKEMALHRYHIQMLFYVLALKQYVSSRFGSIPFEDIFGGAFYLFVRGIEPEQDTPENSNGVYFVSKSQILPVINRFAPYLSEPDAA